MRNIVLFFVLALLTMSCNVGDKIFVGEPQDVEFRGINNNNIKIVAKMPITNNNAFRVKIKDVNLEARIDGKFLGTVSCAEAVIIKGNTDDVYEIPLQLEIKNIILGAATIYRLRQNREKPSLSLEGEILTSGLLLRKKIPIKEEDILRYMN
ncbi:MAG: hypothetical protein ACOC2F_00255 [Bacteroidota bacterium]